MHPTLLFSNKTHSRLLMVATAPRDCLYSHGGEEEGGENGVEVHDCSKEDVSDVEEMIVLVALIGESKCQDNSHFIYTLVSVLWKLFAFNASLY